MTLAEIKERLVRTGFPVAYSHFKSKTAPPFICYMQTVTDNFAADDTMYFPVKGVRIELYTCKKDVPAEEKVEAALSGIYWEMSESYIKEENLFQIVYEIEV